MRRLAHALRAALLVFGLSAGLSVPAAAECHGQDLFAAMAPDRRARLEAAADAVPFARGNLWQATKAGMRLVIAGTYHLDDPRHAQTMAVLAPELARARLLLVEAGPEDEHRLMKALGSDPSLMFLTEGPSLLQRLPPQTWARLAGALERRGVPAVLGAKFRPWYATMVLAIPPCAIGDSAAPRGLDLQLVEAARAAGREIRALEPWDTILTIFDGFTAEQELDMLESALALESRSEDFSTTLAEAYFRGEARLIWELTREFALEQPGQTPAAVDAEMAVMEEALMAGRNRAWIAPIEAAAARGPALVAFGALHLSGEEGVLNLLAGRGWTVAPLSLPAPPRPAP